MQQVLLGIGFVKIRTKSFWASLIIYLLWYFYNHILGGWFIQKIVRSVVYPKHVITGQSHQTNKHFILKLGFF